MPFKNRKPVCDFLLVFHVNYMPIFYRFRDVTIYWWKSCIFAVLSHPSPLGLMVSNIVSKKWSPSVTRRRKPHDPAIISFDALPARDGQTERQKDRQTDGYTALAKSRCT